MTGHGFQLGSEWRDYRLKDGFGTFWWSIAGLWLQQEHGHGVAGRRWGPGQNHGLELRPTVIGAAVFVVPCCWLNCRGWMLFDIIQDYLMEDVS